MRIVNIACVLLVGPLFTCGLSSCSPGMPIGVADYPSKIVGSWWGDVGDKSETISFSADGTFVSQERSRGFISNTLGQGVTGTIRGTWAIRGKSIELNISSAEDVRLSNRATTSTIETFKENEIVVKSGTGDISTFTRQS
jgi:hypothetical protein